MTKQKDQSDVRITSKMLQSLRLPTVFDSDSHKTALDLDDFLAQDERSIEELAAKITVHRKAALSHLMKFSGTQLIDGALFSWPPHLFIPRSANPRDYWFGSPPPRQLYALAWTYPATTTTNSASRDTGKLSSFSGLKIERPGENQSSESTVGVFYSTTMSYGVVELQPHVNCFAQFGTLMGFFPNLASGYVEVKAELLLAAWQLLPSGGLDLLGFKSFDVATSGQKTETHGSLTQSEIQSFQKSFAGSDLSAQFIVQTGRTYLFGVVNRITVASTLKFGDTSINPLTNKTLRAWGVMNCDMPEIDIITKQVYIP